MNTAFSRFVGRVAVVLVAIVATLVTANALPAQEPRNTPATENPPAQNPPAQSGPADSGIASVSDSLRQEITDFFNQYEVATRADDTDEILGLFDFPTFVDSVFEQAEVAVEPAVRGQMISQMRMGIKRQFELMGDRWVRHRVIQLAADDDEKKVEAYVRNWSDDGFTTRTIFWLKKTDRWRIIDWMDLSMGFGNASLMSAVIRDAYGAQHSPDIAKSLQLLLQAMLSTWQEDHDSARQALEDMTGRTLPPSLETLRWCIEAAISLESDPIRSLEHLDKLEAFDPKAVIADFVRFGAYFSLEEYDRTIFHADRYLSRFGADENAYYAKALAHAELGQHDESIAAFEAGLADTPESITLLMDYAVALPSDQKQKINGYFKTLPDPMASFEEFADYLEVERDFEGLQVLLDAARSISDDVPYSEYFEGLILANQGHFEQAIEKLITGRDRLEADDFYRRFFDRVICEAAVKSSQPMRAYEISDSKVHAFETLLGLLDQVLGDESSEASIKSTAQADVTQLISKHLPDFEKDSETLLILGNRAYFADDMEQAKTYFTLALQHATEDDDTEMIRSDLIDCHVQTNTIVDYYKTSDDKIAVFEIVIYRLDPETEAYQELEKLHRAEFPNLPEYAIERIEGLYESQRYQETVDACRSVEADDDESYAMMQVTIFETLSLARLGKADEAILKARQIEEPMRDQVRAAIYAIRVDRQSFRKALKRYIDSEASFSPEEFSKWAKVPGDWLEGLGWQVGRGGESADAAESILPATYDSYSELRRIVFLTTTKTPVKAPSVREVAEGFGLSLFEVRPDQLSTQDDNYVCQLAGDAVLVAADGCKFFLSARPSKFLKDLDQVTGLVDEELAPAVEQHSSWFSIDVFAWPQTAGSDDTTAIPLEAKRNLVRLAKAIVGDKATVAVHVDLGEVVACDSGLFTRLEAEPTVLSFLGPESFLEPEHDAAE